MLVILHNNVQVTVRSTGMRHESSCCLHEHVKATSRVLNVWLPVPEWAKKTSRGSNQREQSLKGRHFCSFLQRYRTFWYLLWCGLLHLPRWDWLSWWQLQLSLSLCAAAPPGGRTEVKPAAHETALLLLLLIISQQQQCETESLCRCFRVYFTAHRGHLNVSLKLNVWKCFTGFDKTKVFYVI